MPNLQLIKSENFGTVKCDFWKDSKGNILMTRDQIGQALEYATPNDSIRKIHDRHKDRLEKFSVSVKLSGTDGKFYNTYLYSAKGVYEICRWSQQPKADAFYDWVYGLLEGLRKGDLKLQVSPEKKKEIEARYNNSLARKANVLLKIANNPDINPRYRQVLQSQASAIIAGKPLLPLPESEEKTLTAKEIGVKLGISANMVGRLALKHNLKTSDYGKWFHDKSPYSSKEVESFRYYENVIPEFERALGL